MTEVFTAPEAIKPLTQIANWVGWRWVKIDPEKPPTKIPYQIGGGKARVNDPKTWGAFERLMKVAKKFDGVGFVLTDAEIAAFDIDDCRDPLTGRVHPWAEKLVRYVNCYTEITPSGKGLRILGIGKGPAVKTGKRLVADNVGLELYRKRGYITVTGNVYLDRPMIEIDQYIDEHIGEERLAQLRGEGQPKEGEEEGPADINLAREALKHIDPDMPRGDWIAVGSALANAFGEEGFELWDEWSKGGKKYKRREMRGQWQSLQQTKYSFSLGSLYHFANQANEDWRVEFDARMQEEVNVIDRAALKEIGVNPDKPKPKKAKAKPAKKVKAQKAKEPAEPKKGRVVARKNVPAADLVEEDEEETGEAEETFDDGDDDQHFRDNRKDKKKKIIKVLSGKIDKVVDKTEKALVQSGLPVLVRAGCLVQPLFSDFKDSSGHTFKITTLKVVTPNNLTYILAKHVADYYKFDKRLDQWKPVDPPEKVVAGVLDLGHWGLPRCSGVISTPTLRPDGGLLIEPGYDSATRLWHWPDQALNMPAIPDEPTKSDAEAALKLLKKLFDEFAFVRDLDFSVAMAALLTSMVRGAFDVAPMFLFTAPQPGTGKSFMADVIGHIVTGRFVPVITSGSNPEEIEKRMGAILLEGPPLISLDNLKYDIEGEMLCQMTERPLVKVRVLGKSETPECEWRGTLFATGNNIRFIGDMTRRGLTCRLDAKTERPEFRSFDHDPLEDVKTNRGKYIAAVLTLVRAYLVNIEKQKHRVKCAPVASYGKWSKFVREPLIWLGLEDPLKSMEEARREDPNRTSLARLIEQWKLHIGIGKEVRASDIANIASEKSYEQDSSGGFPGYVKVRPEFYELLLENVSSFKRGVDIETKRLGRWLKNLEGQIYDDHRIILAKADAKHGTLWRLEKVE